MGPLLRRQVEDLNGSEALVDMDIEHVGPVTPNGQHGPRNLDGWSRKT